MYGHWAGDFRRTNKNIGVDKWQISTDLKYLLDDALYWHKNNTYPPDEIAIRFKHRLVSIHCFPNGNGRHSRLMADIIIEKIFKQAVFSWGDATFPAKAKPEQPTSKRSKLPIKAITVC
jgi:Fic-DOC domain mobile mystery protein B